MMDEDGQLSEFARQLLLRHHRVASAPVSEFVADGLDDTNTGVPSGTSLTEVYSPTYDSANDGQTISAKWFSGRVTLDGADNITFENCDFYMDDWFPVIFWTGQLDTMSVTFNYCTFHAPPEATTNPIGAHQARGATFYRCLFYNCTDAIRCESNVLIDQCYFGVPLHQDGAHCDGIELYGDNGPVSNVEIRDSKFAMGPDSWDVGGGITACINASCDSDTVDDLRVYRNHIDGGTIPVRFTGTSPVLCSNVQFIGNHVVEGTYGFTDVTEEGEILYWEDNFDANDLTESGRIIDAVLLGVERPAP